MRVWMITLAFTAALAAGCHRQGTRPSEYTTTVQDPNRDTETARRENGRALALVEQGKLDEAEKVLKAALVADLFFGPAHNNLGVVYHRKEQYYLAAWEFQYAAKLMPHSPEPRNNLGLVYESVGRLAEAEPWFDQALALQPDNPALLGNLTRLRVRAGQMDEKTRRLLADLALKATDPQWAKWARDRLALMGPSQAGPASEEPPSTDPGPRSSPSQQVPPDAGHGGQTEGPHPPECP